jgi:hypothetical protein
MSPIYKTLIIEFIDIITDHWLLCQLCKAAYIQYFDILELSYMIG